MMHILFWEDLLERIRKLDMNCSCYTESSHNAVGTGGILLPHRYCLCDVASIHSIFGGMHSIEVGRFNTYSNNTVHILDSASPFGLPMAWYMDSSSRMFPVLFSFQHIIYTEREAVGKTLHWSMWSNVGKNDLYLSP